MIATGLTDVDIVITSYPKQWFGYLYEFRYDDLIPYVSLVVISDRVDRSDPGDLLGYAKHDA